MEARFGIPAPQEDDPLGPLPADTSNRPDVAGEGVLLQVEEELLQGVRPAPSGADEFTLWEQEVLGRRVPSLLASIPRAPLKRFQPSSSV